MTDDELFTRLGRMLDKGMDAAESTVKKGASVVLDSGAQILHAVGLDAVEAAVFSGTAKAADAVGAHKTASAYREGAALFHSDVDRAHFTQELEKRVHKVDAALDTSAASASPKPPQTQREKTAEVQRLLKEAGYGDLLTRHGEKNDGLDGVRGRDTITAENQYRKDHHLAANAAISGGESVPGEPKAPSTPSVAKATKLREI